MRLPLDSLRVRLILLVLLAALPTLGLTLYLVHWLRSQDTERFEALLLAQTQAVASDHRQYLNTIRLTLNGLSRYPETHLGDPALCAKILDDLSAAFPGYLDDLFVARPDGTVYCSIKPGLVGTDVGATPWFRRGQAAGSFRVGEYEAPAAPGSALVHMTLPVPEPGREGARLLVARINLTWFNTFLTDSRLPDGGAISVIDRSGTILLHYPHPADKVGKNIASLPLWQAIQRGSIHPQTYAADMDGGKLLVTHATVGPEYDPFDYLVFSVPAAALEAEADRLFRIGLLAILAVCSLGLALGWLASHRWVLRPLQPVLRTVRRVARGDLGARVGPSQSCREIDALAREVDAMATSLEEQDEALRGSLERSRQHLQAADAITHSEAMQAGDVNTLAYELTELAALVTGVARAAVWLFDSDGAGLTCIDLYEASPAQHTAGARLDEDGFGIEFDSFRHTPYVASHDPAGDPRTTRYATGHLGSTGVTSLLHAVIQIADRQLGVLCLEHVSQPPHRWEQDEVAFACLLADRLGLVLANRERRQAELATRREQRQAQAYLDVVGVMVVALDRQGHVTLMNRKTCELLGYVADAGDSQPPAGGGVNWFRDHLPEALADAQASIFRLVMDGEVDLAAYTEYPVRTTAGRQRLIAWHNALLRDDDGAIIGCLSAGQDVTDSRRIEAALLDSRNRFQTLVENIPGTVFRCAVAHPRPVQHVSPSVLALTGTPAERFLDGSVVGNQLVHPDDLERVLEAIAQGISQRQPYAVEYRLRHADGTYRTVEERGRAVFDADGRPAWLDGVIMDISERKRAEEEREQLVGQLRQAQKMEALGLLTGGIAHDFNNILASVLGFARLAQRRHAPDPDSELAEYLREVIAAGERARDLIVKMLAFSRKQPDRRALPLPPTPQVKEAMRMLSAALPSSIEIETHFDPDVPEIAIDPIDLQQILMNLIINARDAVDGKGHIVVELARTQTQQSLCTACHGSFSGDWLKLTVVDDGKGIPDALLDRIFDPFFTTKEVGQGTGMGLAMVQGLVHRAGGHFMVASVPGQGTTFQVFLPPAAGSGIKPAPESSPPRHRAALPATPVPSKRGRLMVVDDEKAILRLLQTALGEAGWQVSAYDDPRQALAAFSQAPDEFVALVSDVTMPGMTGPELAAALRELRPDLPVILCTGHQSPTGFAAKALNSVNRFFYKPVDPDELHAALMALCPPRT